MLCLSLSLYLPTPPIFPSAMPARLRRAHQAQGPRREVLACDGKPHHPCRVKLQGVDRSQEVHDSLGPGHDLLAGTTSPPDSTIRQSSWDRTGRQTHKHTRRDMSIVWKPSLRLPTLPYSPTTITARGPDALLPSLDPSPFVPSGGTTRLTYDHLPPPDHLSSNGAGLRQAQTDFLWLVHCLYWLHLGSSPRHSGDVTVPFVGSM